MGCICSKGKSTNDYVAADNHHHHLHLTQTQIQTDSKPKHSDNDTATARLITHAASTPISSDEDKNAKSLQPKVSRIFSVTRGERGAQVLAGWPSWLTAVAGEAISGWIPRRADSFEKLDKATSILSFFPFLFFIASSYSSVIHSFFGTKCGNTC